MAQITGHPPPLILFIAKMIPRSYKISRIQPSVSKTSSCPKRNTNFFIAYVYFPWCPPPPSRTVEPDLTYATAHNINLSLYLP